MIILDFSNPKNSFKNSLKSIPRRYQKNWNAINLNSKLTRILKQKIKKHKEQNNKMTFKIKF